MNKIDSIIEDREQELDRVHKEELIRISRTLSVDDQKALVKGVDALVMINELARRFKEQNEAIGGISSIVGRME